MKVLVSMVLVAFAAQQAVAQDDARSLQLKIDETNAALQALELEVLKTLHGNTLESLGGQMRDVDKRTFELDIETARAEARREAVLAKVKEEESRRQLERELLQRKLDVLKEKRLTLQKSMEKASVEVDAGLAPPEQMTAFKMRLIDLDREMSAIEFAPPPGMSHFGEMLAEIEVELAGIRAARGPIERYEAKYTELFHAAVGFEEGRLALLSQGAELEQQLAEIQTAAKLR